MALVSPGLQISVTDESQYVPGAVGSVPLIILATAQDKTNPNGSVAAGTTKANAGLLQAYTSQRELVNAFGYPDFKQSSAGTALHGDERNEYGLMAAYSALGIGNRVYAIRADVDLTQLVGTSIRPTGAVANGTVWLDTADSDWGIYEWDATAGTYNKKPTTLITDPTTLVNSGGVYYPAQSIGAIGAYAVALTPTPSSSSSAYNQNVWYVYHKNQANVWSIVGSAAWQLHNPTIKSGNSFTANATAVPMSTPAATILINGHSITIGSTSADQTLEDVAAAINTASNNGADTGALATIRAGVNATTRKLEIYGALGSKSNGSTPNGKIAIAAGQGTPLATFNILAGTYNTPVVAYGDYASIPAWGSRDPQPRPSGSVFIKTGAIGSGANLVFKKYSSSTGTWTTIAAPMYQHGADAIYNLDPSGGGYNIAAGTVWVRYDVTASPTGTVGVGTFKPYYRRVAGATKVTAAVTNTASPFTTNDTFTVKVSEIGSSELSNAYSCILSGQGRASFVSAILAANIPELTAAVEANGAISITHKYGGSFAVTETQGTPFQDAGFSTSIAGIQVNADGTFECSSWSPLVYTYSATEPTKNPDDGALWYYSNPVEVDIMINTSTGWKGYLNETADSRGYDLSATDVNGVIVSASKPTSQSDGYSSIASGDLWLDSGDLENYPALYRARVKDGTTTWTKIDKTDNIGQNGIIFADARWDADGTTDPISGDLPMITDLLSVDRVDQDAPDYRLYPRGILLFNTRRSGYNIKRFVSNYFTDANFGTLPNVPGADGSLPTVTSTWISASGLKDDGSMYAGHQAQRHMVVSAMKAAVDGNASVREDQYQFNLLAAPGYPELIANMVALNNDRANTGFIIGDTPMRLAPSTIAIANWSNNTDNSTGLTTNDPYLGVYYPGAAQTNDLAGNTIVVPPSHIAIRTYLHSDNASYPWFAPAGTRRGMVDNANSVGYIDSATGEYNPIGVTQGLRDSLYENKINPITNLPGVGLVIWGQKTRNPVASSMDRVNVARLVNYIRTILATVGNGFLFEPNDKITRDHIKAIISGAINDLVSKRGIYDYLVVCDDSNNTPTRIARNELYVDIAIEPMKDVEFIYIPIRLYNPGAIATLGA